MIGRLHGIILLVGMVAASGLAWALKPTAKVADQGEKFSLELMVPRAFGEWREVQLGGAQIVDPTQRATLDRIYNQTLTRTYVNARGYVIMLSIAYGSDQSDGLAMHLPDLCYPAQGFQVDRRTLATLELPGATIAATRLVAQLGPRVEPLTYWSVVGDRVVRGGIEKKLVEMRFGLFERAIPDGMLIRVSSIDPDSARAFAQQDRFAEALLGAVGARDRPRLSGAQAQ